MEARPHPDEREFLTPAEVAALLRVSARTVRNEIRAGRMPGRKASARRYTIPAQLLREWAEQREEPAGKEAWR
jgi:excisionase family DNA binding protein